MKIREYIEKIVDNNNLEDMEKLGDMLEDILLELKKRYPEEYHKYKMCLHEIAYGKVITREMAEAWVSSMDPAGKWDYKTTSSVRTQYGITDIEEIPFYIVMNMLYSDMRNVLGNGDTNESLTKYIQATRDWLGDPDASKDKLYDYKKYIVL
jgi:predicted NodU family carbamoyl transferase